MTEANTTAAAPRRTSAVGLYLAFGAAGLVIGLAFPPVASLFVKEWIEGRLPWFVLACVAAGEMMALVAAVSVRSTSASGIHAVRSTSQLSPTMSHSAEIPWPVAYSGVSA